MLPRDPLLHVSEFWFISLVRQLEADDMSKSYILIEGLDRPNYVGFIS